MKFELFQRQPAVDYEPRLSRVSRQLRDIRGKVCLTELASCSREEIKGKLHHARCIYNALSDIKPEVENVIKMGRKIVASEEETVEDRTVLTKKIDELKGDFNDIGAQITEAKKCLERALDLAEEMEANEASLKEWLKVVEEALANSTCLKDGDFLKQKHSEVMTVRTKVKCLARLKDDFAALTKKCAGGGSVKDVQDKVESLELRWRGVLAQLKAALERSKASNPEDEKLVGLRFDEPKLILMKSSSSNDGFLADEFRAAFDEVSAWVDEAEVRLKQLEDTDRLSQERELSSEVEEWRPKVSDLRALSEKLVESFVGLAGDRDNMKRLGQRWEEIVKQVEERLKRRRSFKMVEVEEIKTTISHLSIVSPASPVTTTTSTLANAIADMDQEVIDTLPEELAPVAATSRRRPASGDEGRLATPDKVSRGASMDDETAANSSLLSSRESSPDIEVVTGTMILHSNSPTFIKETVSKIPRHRSPSNSLTRQKPNEEERQQPGLGENSSPTPPSSPPSKTPPPKTLPKPRWFSLKRKPPQEESNGNLSDEDVDAYVAKENSAIERILTEATNDLAEVRRKASSAGYQPRGPAGGGSDYQQRTVKEFEASVEAMLVKIAGADERLGELEEEQDLKLRRDLIAMEAKVIEAEVATLISRGDTLILFTHRTDVAGAADLQRRVCRLRETWQTLKKKADGKRIKAQRQEDDMARLARGLDEFLSWMSRAEKALSPGGSPAAATAMRATSHQKGKELERLQDVAKSFNEGSLGSCGTVLAAAEVQWRRLEPLLKQTSSNPIYDISPRYQPDNATTDTTAEVLSRISKMREAVEAVDRQLGTQLLSSGKHYESLNEQGEALETAKNALERLRPTIKKTAKDLEALTGSLSVEYLEKVVVQSERLRDEWQRVNKRFRDRQVLWNECRRKFDEHRKKTKELMAWLDQAQKILLHSTTSTDAEGNTGCSQEHIQLERQVSEKNKTVTSAAVSAREIMNKTSAQERLEVQEQVDRVLKQWKYVLSQLAAHRERLNREKYANNVNYMNHWVDEHSARLISAINPSDGVALREAARKAREYAGPLAQKQLQMEKLAANHNANHSAVSSEAVQALKNRFEALLTSVPHRQQELEAQRQRLIALESRLTTLSVWLDHAGARLSGAERDVGQPGALKQIKSSLDEKAKEMTRLMDDVALLRKDARAKGFDLVTSLEARIDSLSRAWEELFSNCRRALSKQELEDRVEASLAEESVQSCHHDRPVPAERQSVRRVSKDELCQADGEVEDEEIRSKAPQVYAELRDRRDWVRRKRAQLSSLTLAGDVSSVQRQLDDHASLR